MSTTLFCRTIFSSLKVASGKTGLYKVGFLFQPAVIKKPTCCDFLLSPNYGARFFSSGYQQSLIRNQSSILHNTNSTNRAICPMRNTICCISSVRYLAVASDNSKVEGIQTHVSALSAKRTVRKKKLKEKIKQQDDFVVSAYATSEEYHLENIIKDMEEQGLYQIQALPGDVTDTLYAVANYAVDEEPREIFMFREGSVVFWNFPESEANAVLKFLRSHEVDSYDINMVQLEYEEMNYNYTENATQLKGGDIALQRPSEEVTDTYHDHLLLEKYAFSNAMAISVKLGVWESSLNGYVQDIEWVTEDLRAGRILRITRRDVLRKTGELFTLRHLINLSSDLLDTPDFYWDRESLEALYVKTCAHFNISKRTKVMNEKLSHCCELTELLTSNLNDAHHVRLEWMIIVLILVEVVFELIRYAEEYQKKVTHRNQWDQL